MIHCVYMRRRAKDKWHLVSWTLSPEAVMQDAQELRDKAAKDGNEKIQVAVQSFESNFYIPELLSSIKQSETATKLN